MSQDSIPKQLPTEEGSFSLQEQPDLSASQSMHQHEEVTKYFTCKEEDHLDADIPESKAFTPPSLDSSEDLEQEPKVSYFGFQY